MPFLQRKTCAGGQGPQISLTSHLSLCRHYDNARGHPAISEGAPGRARDLAEPVIVRLDQEGNELNEKLPQQGGCWRKAETHSEVDLVLGGYLVIRAQGRTKFMSLT